MTAANATRKFCPKMCDGDRPSGKFVCFCPSTDDRRACDVYRCHVCGEMFALTYDGFFCPVPAEAVTS